MKPSLVACLMVCYLLGTALGKTVYVGPAGVGTDSIGCGNTTTNACSLLGVAFDPMKGGVVDGDTVELMAGVYDDSNSPGALDLGLYGQHNVTVAGQGIGISIINLNNEHHLVLNGNNGWIIANMTIRNGLRDDGGDGGCLSVDGDLDIIDASFENCNATTGNGGAFSFTGDSSVQLVLDRVRASNCFGGEGGCFHAHSSGMLRMQARDLHMEDGSATSIGGCFAFLGDSTSLIDVVGLTAVRCEAIGEQVSPWRGGGCGIVLNALPLEYLHLQDCSTSARYGGGLYLEATSVLHSVVTNSITTASGSGGGGGILLRNPVYSNPHFMSNVTVEECRVDGGDGFAISAEGDFTLHACTLRRNTGSGRGALIHGGIGSLLELSGGTEIIGNQANGVEGQQEFGAGILVSTILVNPEDWDAVITQNSVLLEGKTDNVACHVTHGANCIPCGACGFGQCDFNPSSGDAGTACRCWPGVKDVPNKGAPCNACLHAGMGFDHELRRCEICEPGTYSGIGVADIEECIPCPLGTYSETPEGIGLLSCTPCPPNTYSNASTAGATSSDVCVPCPPGLSSKEGSLSCDSGDASGDITNAVVAINGDLADLETSLGSRIGDLESDIASVLTAINTFTPPDAIEGGVRIGVKVYCDADYQHNSSGDGCEPIPPPELTPTTALAVSISLAAFAALGIGFMLLRSPGSHGGRQLPPSPKTPNSSL